MIMQIQILAAAPSEKMKLTVAERKLGQAPVKYTVASGEKITVIVDGVTLTGSQIIANRKFKLVKSGADLIIQVDDEDMVELLNFYSETDALLVGDQWVLTDGSQLQQLAEGVAVFEKSGAAVAELALAEFAVAELGLGSLLGISAAAPLVISAAGSGAQGSNNPMPKVIGRPFVAIPEALGGINSAEAADGLPVLVTLPTGAAVGDVITISIDGSVPVTYIVTAADLNQASNPSGTVSVLLPSSAVAFAGKGPATVNTTYTDAAGNSATGGSVLTEVIIADQPSAPTVDVKTENSSQPVVTGTATLQAGDRLTVTVNGATYNDVAVDNTGHWSINTATALPSSGSLGAFVNGQSYSIVATVSNAIGNASDASNNEITIVTNVAVPVLTLVQDSGRSASDLVTANGTVSVSNLVVGATWQYSLDGGTTWIAGNGGAVATSTTSSFTAPEGVFDAGRIVAKQTIANNTSSIGELLSTSTQPQGLVYNMEEASNIAPQVAALTDGGYVVAWRGQVFNESSLDFEIFTQRFDSSNRALGAPQVLLGQSNGTAANVHLTATVDGGYFVVWNETTPGVGTLLYFQRFDGQNTAMGAAQSFVATPNNVPYSPNSPMVVALENGGAHAGAVLVWTDEINETSIQGIDSNGQLIGSPLILTADGQSTYMDVTALQNGGYVVTCTFVVMGLKVASAKIFDNNHNLVGEINTNQTHGGITTVKSLSDGGFVMAYQAGNDNDIYYLRSDATGNILGGPTSLNRPDHADRPSITVLPNGDYVLCWIEETPDNQSFDVFTQLIDGVTNLPSSTAVRLQGESGNWTDSPVHAITMDNGDYLVVWGGGPNGSLYSQLFNSTGTAQGGVNNLTAVHGNFVSFGDLTVLDDGGYVITGHKYDQASNSYDILVMRFDDNHQPVDETLALTVDNTGPSLLSSAPLDDAQDYAGDSNITLVYSEKLALGSSGLIVIKDLSDNSTISIDLANPQGQVETMDNRLIINPTVNLTPGRHYSLHLDAGVVTDVAGNSNAAINNDSDLDFTIGLPTTLSLGNVNGLDLNLIGGFKTNDNKWYYYLDFSNDSSATDSLNDQINHDDLDNLLNSGTDTVETQLLGAVAGIDDERTVVIGGYTLVLPTASELLPVLNALDPSSQVWSIYDSYWTATPSNAEEHLVISAVDFQSSSASDQWLNSVAFQVII